MDANAIMLKWDEKKVEPASSRGIIHVVGCERLPKQIVIESIVATWTVGILI